MKTEIFKSIQSQLEPDETVIAELLSKAEKLNEKRIDQETDKVQKENITADKNNQYECSNNTKLRGRYTLIFSTAAAALIVVGLTVFLTMNKDLNHEINNSEPAYFFSSDSFNESSYTAVPVTYSTSREDSMTDMPESKYNEENSSLAYTDSQNDESEISDDSRFDEEKAAWFPDPEPEGYGNNFSYPEPDENGNIKAIAKIENMPTDEYQSFEYNDMMFDCVNEYYGADAVYIDYSCGRNIPNPSYVDRSIGYVSMVSDRNDSSVEAEIYKLKYIDENYIVGVKFEDNPRYFLYANKSYSYDSFAEFTQAINFEKCALGGEVFNRDNYYNFAYIDDETELVQLILSLDGEKTEYNSDVNVWESFLNAPLYGGGISFKWYPDGYVKVNTFGVENTYNIGRESAVEIIDYINNNSHG